MIGKKTQNKIKHLIEETKKTKDYGRRNKLNV